MDNELAKALLKNDVNLDYDFEKTVERSIQEREEKENQEVIKKDVISNDTSYLKNPIADLIKIVAVLEVIGGLIIGIQLGTYEYGTYYTQTKINGAVVFMWIVIGAMSGLLTLGFAEIIQLLHDIKNNTLNK